MITTTTTTTSKNSTTIILIKPFQRTNQQQTIHQMATSTDPNKSLLKLNPFQLANAIDTITGSKIANITKLNNGYILLETHNDKQSIALQRAEFLDSIPVKISPHNSTNFSKAVIKTPES